MYRHNKPKSQHNHSKHNSPAHDRRQQARNKVKGLKIIKKKEHVTNNRPANADQQAWASVSRWYSSLTPLQKVGVTAAGLLSVYTLIYFALLSDNQATSSATSSSFSLFPVAAAAPISNRQSVIPDNYGNCVDRGDGLLECERIRTEEPMINEGKIVGYMIYELCKWRDKIPQTSIEMGVDDYCQALSKSAEVQSAEVKTFPSDDCKIGLKYDPQLFSGGGICLLVTSDKEKGVCCFDLHGHQVLVKKDGANPDLDPQLKECAEALEKRGFPTL